MNQNHELREQALDYMTGLLEANGWELLRRDIPSRRWLGFGVLTVKLDAERSYLRATLDDGVTFEWVLRLAWDDAHAGADEALAFAVQAEAERWVVLLADQDD